MLKTLILSALVSALMFALPVLAAENPFALKDLGNLPQIADNHGGKCGGESKAADADSKCGGKQDTASESKCGGKQEAASDSKCGGEKKESETKSCGSGKCGAGKCGGSK